MQWDKIGTRSTLLAGSKSLEMSQRHRAPRSPQRESLHLSNYQFGASHCRSYRSLVNSLTNSSKFQTKQLNSRASRYGLRFKIEVFAVQPPKGPGTNSSAVPCYRRNLMSSPRPDPRQNPRTDL